MIILPILFAFIFGAIVGSFLNVVIWRFGTGRSVWAGRSICLFCAAPLRWFELVPILSFIWLGGRCRRCAGKISRQYPLVEFGTASLFGLTVWRVGFAPALIPWLLLYFAAISVLAVIAVYDLRHKIIPDPFVFAFVGLALVKTVVVGRLVSSLVAGAALFLFFFLLWFFSRGRWMGLGDAKLALGAGLFLGWPAALSAVALSFWTGAAAGLLFLLFSRSFTIKSEMPFAPFIILGTLTVFFFNVDVLSALERIFN